MCWVIPYLGKYWGLLLIWFLQEHRLVLIVEVHDQGVRLTYNKKSKPSVTEHTTMQGAVHGKCWLSVYIRKGVAIH